MNKQKPPQLTIVIPIYNEEACLPSLLDELVSLCALNNWNAILVNDGSTDNTRAVLSNYEGRKNISVLHHKLNRGYGGALKTGIMNVRTPYLCTMDADGQHSMEDVGELYRLALEKDADLVVGDRGRLFQRDFYRSLGKWLIRGFARLIMPLPIRDLNSGFKLYRTFPAQRYAILCPNSMAFSDVVTLIFINQRDLVLEHPISIAKRMAGKSTISINTAFETVIEIINIALMFNPLKIFLPVAAICLFGGLGWGIPFILKHHGISIGALLAILTGIFLITIGLLANQLATIRMDQLQHGTTKGIKS